MERKRDYMTVQELTENEKYKFWYFKTKNARKVVYLSKISVTKTISSRRLIIIINKKSEIFYVIR